MRHHYGIALHNFDLLHMDIWGPCSKTSMHGHKYFLTIVDDHSRFTWIHLMHSKAETRDIIIGFITFIETQHNKRVKTIRSDNGPELEERISAQLVEDTSLEIEMRLKVNVGMYKTLNKVMAFERYAVPEWVA